MSRLRTIRHEAVYRTPRELPRPDALRSRLDTAMREVVPERLAQSLGLPKEDPSVVLIRHLPVRVAIRGDWNESAIADAWTAAIAKSLHRALEDVREGTMVFADRAAYLKEFLIDRAAGHAHERWYYRTFDGLALLPLSSAIRTAVLEDPFVGEQALVQMSPPARNGILRSLSEADAARTLRGLVPGAGPEPSDQAIVQALGRIENGSQTAALRTYLELREHLPEEPREAVYTATTTVAAYLQAVARVKNVDRLIEAIGRRDLATLILLTDANLGQALMRLEKSPVEALYRAVGVAPAETSAQAPLRRSTPHGGAFLLLESLAELPLDDWCRDWPSAGELPASQVVRWLLLLQGLGTDRSYSASYDPVLRDLLSLPPDLDLRAWCRAVKTPLLTELGIRLEAWQSSRGVLSGRRGNVSGVWIDDERGLFVPGGTGDLDDLNEETKARLRHVPADRAYLRPDSRIGVSRRVADGLAPLALNVLRTFSWRLPGFGRSHLQHLSRNFLACTAEVTREGDTLLVSLSRPPLDLVLRMTRIARPSISIPWTTPTELSLFL